MRVLWVCNIMLPVIARHFGLPESSKEGWVSGLAREVLQGQSENRIELAVAFPVEKEQDGCREEIAAEGGRMLCYGFYEDMNHAEKYEEALEARLVQIVEEFSPDVVHCFGTEYGHALALTKSGVCGGRLLVSLQGLCTVCAQAYMADLPLPVQKGLTFRDWLKKDSIPAQQEKFTRRGIHEQEVIRGTANVAGRTAMDAFYTALWNPSARYFHLNETLRTEFYEGKWPGPDAEPHTIFVSQGDYPLKGLHYALLAMPKILHAFPDARLVVAGNSLVSYESLRDKLKLSRYGKYLRELIRENGLEEKVHFTGMLSASGMKEQMLRSGLFLCCSSMENSPNSLGEAMLLGLPCVAADVGGIPSLFEDGADGIAFRGYRGEDIAFYASLQRQDEGKTQALQARKQQETQKEKEKREPENPDIPGTGLLAVSERLAAAVTETWTQEERTRERCSNARAHAARTHDGKANYKRLLEIYEQIAEENGA